jgi:hypothetical protein
MFLPLLFDFPSYFLLQGQAMLIMLISYSKKCGSQVTVIASIDNIGGKHSICGTSKSLCSDEEDEGVE